jgi:RHS repeat-associated protein
VHTDNILGSNVISNSSGVKDQLLDYFPFGDIRLNEQSSSFNEQKKFGGHYYDTETGLIYMGARYYNGKGGRFLSQDPMFWTPEKLLENPQSMNSYSYALNNPITNIDPDGREAKSTIKKFWNSVKKVLGINKSIQNSTPIESKNLNIGHSVLEKSDWIAQQPRGCMDACAQTAGYRPDPSHAIDIMKYDSTGNLNMTPDTQKGLQVIDQYLTNDKPIIVGVNRGQGGTESANRNIATQHFVTISGYNYDKEGTKYYNFYDPGTQNETNGTSPNNRLYPKASGSLSGSTAYNSNFTYMVTEVRPE